MTPQQRLSLIATAKRFGLSGTLVIAAASWGFKQYDKTNASASEVQEIRTRRTIDSLRAVYEYQELHRLVLRIDSTVQKVCTATKAGC